MTSVTNRIKQIKQPYGGFIKVKELTVTNLNDNNILNENENVSASIIGMTVDYLTRFIMGQDLNDAFKISIMGAIASEKLGFKNGVKEIATYLDKIDGLNDNSIVNACKAVTFDVWFRNPFAAINAKKAKETNPDKSTIENIKILILRSIDFWKKFGPIKQFGFTFEGGGYTKTVSSGDGDFLTDDSLWDFKVSKNEPKADHTLQLLMYYIMGLHTTNNNFSKITKLGIFNPRLNKIYIYETKNIKKEIIKEIEEEIICY